jgi:hypothetical protein
MKAVYRIGMSVLSFMVGLSLVVSAAETASATPGFTEAKVSKLAARQLATTRTSAIQACPVPGQRVKTSTSPNVYLIDPDDFINWIPSATDYFNLWDSWDGISVVSDSVLIDCFPEGFFTMSNVHLAKTPNAASVYIWDVNGGGYRWITSGTIFNKYGFSWGKIRTQSSVSPVSSLLWDF